MERLTAEEQAIVAATGVDVGRLAQKLQAGDVAGAATMAVSQPETDPLLAAIRDYRAAGDAYDALPDAIAETEEAADCLLMKPEDILVEWTGPAQSRESAIAALRLAMDELELWDGEPLVCSLVKAALGYLDCPPKN